MGADKKFKIMFQGQMRDATRVPVRNSQEPWSEYLLDDGTVLRMKNVVTDVFRIDGMFDQEGNPIYQIKSNNIASALPSDETTKKSS